MEGHFVIQLMTMTGEPTTDKAAVAVVTGVAGDIGKAPCDAFADRRGAVCTTDLLPWLMIYYNDCRSTYPTKTAK